MADSYSGSSPFDQSVEKATPDTSGEANWSAFMEICDKAGQSTSGPKDCLKSVMKRLSHSSKNVQLHSLTLLDTCILNCGNNFHKEIATVEFVKESRNFLNKASPAVADTFKEHLKKWAETEFKSDAKLSVIPTFYQALRSEGAYFGMGKSGPATTSLVPAPSAAGTDDDLEKALALSLKESQTKSQQATLYPSMPSLGSAGQNVGYAATHTATPNGVNETNSRSQSTAAQVRALYDFEAVEENELTFKTGELITVIDDSDPNWWRGSTWRGEGLFPVNFVSTDLSLDSVEDGSKLKKSVQFNEEVAVEQFDPNSVRVDESVIDQALDQIQNADPTGLTEDSTEMVHLEEECRIMGPMIDQELEKTDSKHNELMSLNQKLTEAFQMYTRLMKEATVGQQYSPAVATNYMTSGAQQPVGTSYLPALANSQQPSSYTYSSPALTEPQPTYYNAGVYPGQQEVHGPAAPQEPPQISQTALLNQYQVNSTATAIGDVQYIPPAPINTLQQPMYNASQTSYQ